MDHSHLRLRAALLGTALALATLTSAAGANLSNDSKRLRAIEGHHRSALNSGEAVPFGNTDPTYTVLHDFAGSPNDGAGSGANVTFDDAGDIYGTTDYGGTNGDGVIFKLAPGGTETILHNFTGGDGSFPDGAVLLTGKGALYGTAGSGGVGDNGVLFQLSAKGKYKVLHDFSTNDGAFLRGNLIRDKLGNLYGTALFGGVNGDGTVYKYAKGGTFTVLHAFNGGDGEFPEHGVVRDAAGNLYGVTAFGGATDNGTVYKITSDGSFSTVYSFTGGADGGFLYGGLAIGSDGNLYGSTVDGGANGAGTVFELTPGGTLTTLYNFTGGADGGSPEGDMRWSKGNLYSTASSGGDAGCQCGVIYQITAKGKERVLHTFVSSTGGGYSAGLVARDKVFYGTTASYGAKGNGVVFRVTKK